MSSAPNTLNLFLAALPDEVRGRLSDHLIPIDLRPGDCLHHAAEEPAHVVFPHSGLVGLTAAPNSVGLAMIGRDGIIGGSAAAAAAPAGSYAYVRAPGHALRLPAHMFRNLLDDDTTVRRLAARYDCGVLAQVRQSVQCNAAHSVEARLCRWLLELIDRVGERLPFTQHVLARTLGVSRTTITLVAGNLQNAGAIRCGRGYVHVDNRRLIEERSCECYGRVQEHMCRLFAEGLAVTPHASKRFDVVV